MRGWSSVRPSVGCPPAPAETTTHRVGSSARGPIDAGRWSCGRSQAGHGAWWRRLSGTVRLGLGTGAPPESPTSDRECSMSDLGRVLVLAGGLSHERDGSLRSGLRVAEALRNVGVEVEQRDVDATLVERLRNDPPDA